MSDTGSLATGQRSLGDPEIGYPLWPALTSGCPRTSTPAVQYPLELTFDYPRVPTALFAQSPLPGLRRWVPLLPPLAGGLGLGEGGTPLVAAPSLSDWTGFGGELLIKDESRNPTWSHKDRLNLCTISAAACSSARGVVVASSGNHGASAAAYAAHAGLPCIVLTTPDAPAAVQSFLLAYGAAVVGLPAEARWPIMRQIAEQLGYLPVSNLTPIHTGHPFGPEGYKTIAYEIFLQLGRRVPAAVFVPTGYAELLYGVWKGFRELQLLGLAAAVPRMFACEPAARAPLVRALAAHQPAIQVAPEPTAAYAVGVTVNGYRGVVAVRASAGAAVAVPDEDALAAQQALARMGLWAELSSVLGLAGLRRALADGEHLVGPVVCISTSSGFKDMAVGRESVPITPPQWEAVRRMLRQRYGIQ